MTAANVVVTDANGNLKSLSQLSTGAGQQPIVTLGDANGLVVGTDGNGNLNTQRGGVNSKLNLTAATVIKAGPGRLRRIIIIAPGGSSGAFTFNDCLTTGAAAASNEIYSLAYSAASAAQVIELDWPCLVGIVLSAVPGASSPIVNVSYD